MIESNGEKFLSPFSEPVQESEFDRLLEFKMNPEKVIHRRGGIDSESSFKLYREGQKIFKIMREKYHISIPEFNYVFAPPESGSKANFVVYTVRDKIHGTPLNEKLSENDDSLRVKLDIFFTNLFRFYQDIYTEGGNYLNDLPPQQFVYGRKRGESEDSVYLIDTDPWYSTFSSNRETLYNSDFFHMLVNLLDLLNTVEEINQFSLLNARNLFRNFVYSIVETSENAEYLSILKKNL